MPKRVFTSRHIPLLPPAGDNWNSLAQSASTHGQPTHLPGLPTPREETPSEETPSEETVSTEAPLGLLPTPTPEEIAGFAQLYERKYGATLDSAQAQRLLSGLMRFLYLTRTASLQPAKTSVQKKTGAQQANPPTG